MNRDFVCFSCRSGTCNRIDALRAAITMAYPMTETSQTRGPVPRASHGHTILLVDADPVGLEPVRRLLERDGHRVLTATRAADAIDLQTRVPVQLVIVDDALDELGTPELVRRLRERDGVLQIVFQGRPPGGRIPRELVRRLELQGYHDKADGPERLLMWVDVALRAYDQATHFRIAERLKTELLGNVSHELRTPLNVIVGYVDLLREGTFGAVPADALQVLAKVRGNADYLLELVEDFLDLSKLEAGAMTVSCEPLLLTPILRELGESFRLLVRTRPVQFVLDVPEGLPAVSVEAAKLRVVVQNLLANAEKFTDHGSITLSAGLLPGRRVAVRVTDTGPGIPTEHQEVIFDVFHQLHPSHGGAKGAGLGLALARRFARMMKGDIAVESTVGRGSTFTLVLPVAAQQEVNPGTAVA